MKRTIRAVRPLVFGFSLIVSLWTAISACAADRLPARSVLSAPRQPQSVAQSELRVVEPKPVPGPARVYPTAQPEPLQPGPNLGGPTPGADMPPVQPLPTTMRESQNIDPSWKPISAVTVTITNPSGELPANLAENQFAQAGVVYAPAVESRNWMEYSYFWQASAFCCGPLYFEEPNLERYGYKFGCLQPAVSAAHFFATIPLLPYKMVVHPPHECVYSLGYYRPGSCAPLQHERFHLHPAAAAAEAGAVIGLILLFN